MRTEFVHDFKKLEYLVFPRIAAFSEAAWLPASSLKYEEFRTRLKSLDQRYRFSGINASKTYDPPFSLLHDTVIRSSMTAAPTIGRAHFDGEGDFFTLPNPEAIISPWFLRLPTNHLDHNRPATTDILNWGCLNCRKTERSGIPQPFIAGAVECAPETAASENQTMDNQVTPCSFTRQSLGTLLAPLPGKPHDPATDLEKRSSSASRSISKPSKTSPGHSRSSTLLLRPMDPPRPPARSRPELKTPRN